MIFIARYGINSLITLRFYSQEWLLRWYYVLCCCFSRSGKIMKCFAILLQQWANGFGQKWPTMFHEEDPHRCHMIVSSIQLWEIDLRVFLFVCDFKYPPKILSTKMLKKPTLAYWSLILMCDLEPPPHQPPHPWTACGITANGRDNAVIIGKSLCYFTHWKDWLITSSLQCY